MVDAETVIYEVLSASGTGLNALVGARVNHERAPKDFVNTGARVVFEFVETEEFLNEGLGAVRGRLTVHCFGATDRVDEAKAVYRAVRDRLFFGAGAAPISVASGALMGAEIVGATVVREEGNEWAKVVGMWGVEVRG